MNYIGGIPPRPEPGSGHSRPCRNRGAGAAAAGIAVVVTAAIGLLDRAAGPALSLAPLQVVGVAVTAWLGGRFPGTMAALVAVASTSAGAATWLDTSIATISLVVLSEMTARHRSLAGRLRRDASTDPLTGALNRRAFDGAAERERRRAERNAQPLSVAYIDLDGFKAYNDRHGHRSGDGVLERLASRIAAVTRTTDVLSRIGGDEFVLLLPGTDAVAAAAALRRVQTVASDDGSGVSASVGIATFRIVPTNVDAMVDAADALMYRAKRLGPGRIVGAVVAGPWLRWEHPCRQPGWALEVAGCPEAAATGG